MTLDIICRWAGARGAVAAIAAFDAVVISGLCAVFGVRSGCGVCKNRACPTPANCRGDTGYPVCVAVCLPAVWVSVMASRSSLKRCRVAAACGAIAAQYYRELR